MRQIQAIQGKSMCLSTRASRSRQGPAYFIDDFLEPDLDRTAVQVFASFGIVDQLAQLPLPHLAGSITKDKQHGVDGIGLARTIGSHDGRKGLEA